MYIVILAARYDRMYKHRPRNRMTRFARRVLSEEK